MKQTLLFICLLSTSALLGQGSGNDYSRPLDNGFHIVVHTTSMDLYSSNMWGFEIGNTFNVYRPADIGLAIGVRVSWLDGSIGIENLDGQDTNAIRLMGSVFAFGPNITYKIQNKLGVEVYYKFKPTFYTEDTENSYASTPGIGITNAFGLSARYDVFQLGVEFGSGQLDGEVTFEDELNFTEETFDRTFILDYSRFFIGFRF